MRRILMASILALVPFCANAGPKEEGIAVFEHFLSDFTAANAEAVAGHFTPEAIFWGTAARELITTPEGIRQYFTTAFGTPARAPGSVKASAAGAPTAVALSDSAVVVSGVWQTEGITDGKPVVRQLRNSITIVKRGDRWLIASFHNSPRPAAP